MLNLVKLGSVCNFVRGPFGGSLKKENFVQDGYAVYEQQHAIYNQFNDIRYFVTQEKFNQMSRFELRSGDLIMSCSGTMGKVALAPSTIKKGIINQALLKLTPNKENYSTYLLWLMRSRYFQDKITEFSAGAAIKNVASVSVLKEIEIPLPPLPVQKAIVAKLDAAFASIDTAIAAAEENAENAKQLFQSYLSDVFEKGGEGWVETTLGDAFNVRDGTHDSPKFVKDGYPLVTSKNLKNGILSLEKIQYISADDYKKINERSNVHKFDVLFAMIGTIGNPVVVEKNPNFAIKNVALFKNPKNNNSYFLRYYLMSDMVLNKMSRDAKGATQKFVSLGYLRQFPISLPNANQQSFLVKSIEGFENHAEKIQFTYKEKLQLLAQLKQSLLQQAFNGQLVDA